MTCHCGLLTWNNALPWIDSTDLGVFLQAAGGGNRVDRSLLPSIRRIGCRVCSWSISHSLSLALIQRCELPQLEWHEDFLWGGSPTHLVTKLPGLVFTDFLIQEFLRSNLFRRSFWLLGSSTARQQYNPSLQFSLQVRWLYNVILWLLLRFSSTMTKSSSIGRVDMVTRPPSPLIWWQEEVSYSTRFFSRGLLRPLHHCHRRLALLHAT